MFFKSKRKMLSWSLIQELSSKKNYYSIFHLLNSGWGFLYSVAEVVPSPSLSKVQSKRLDS